MNITVVGTGYVGLVTGTCLAEVGNHVKCIDIDQEKVDRLNQGDIPIYEPGLDVLVHRNVQEDRLDFSTRIEVGVEHADIIFIAVGTPPDEDGSADLQHVLTVAREIGNHLSDYCVVVTKSTVPVGTAKKVRSEISAALADRCVDIEFSVASNPEFLKEGSAVEDFLKPDRIVVGAEDQRAVDLMRHLYEPFHRSRERLIVMDIPSAELTKYAANSLLATKISFMNDLANIAENLGADIETVRRGIGSDPRIGYHFIYPGCGYGGSCFPKDVQALYKTALDNGYTSRILAAVEDVNRDQKKMLANKVIDRFGKDLSGRSFAVWGLSFKPETDDMRQAPSRTIMETLWGHGAHILAFDPVATEETRRIYGDRKELVLVDDPYQALQDVDALLVITEWKIFRAPDFRKIHQLMAGNSIFDGRNIYNPQQVRDAGLEYFGVGRA